MRLFTNTAPPTRLAGALTDSATTITVDSTAGWPTPTGADVALGCLTYPNADTLELFTYTGKTSTTFTGVVRGVDDTDPKAHLNRALVVHVASWTDLGGGGASTLDGLSDVDTAGATNGDALIYDGAAWGPGAASTVAALDDLTDVTTAGAASGDHLVYDGAGWEPGNPDPDLALDSGTYTPTLTNVTNVSSSSAQVARWIRVGDQVTVYGRISIDPITTATSTQVRVSLPVASNIGSNNDLAGVCVGDLSDESAGHIVGNAANDEALIEAFPVSTAQHTYAYTYSYTII